MARHPLRTLFAEDVRQILDHFAACFGIRIAFFSADGEELVAGLKQPLCRYCKLVRREPTGRQACLADDRLHRQRAAETRRLVAYTCHAGLHEAIQPVVIDDRLVGFVMIGQFRSSTPHTWGEVASLRAGGGRRMASRRELQQAFLQAPYIRPDKLPHVLGLFSTLVDAIASGRLVRVAGDVLVDQAVAFIEANIHRPISLDDVARAVCRSRSSVSHQFKKVLGTSYKQTVLCRKMRHAEQLLRDTPGITVREAARAVGYDDPYHFSRLFRKYRGCPPSKAKPDGVGID